MFDHLGELILAAGVERVDYLFFWIGGQICWIGKCNDMFSVCSGITIDDSINQ